MDDAEFLASAAARLPSLMSEDLSVIEVRPGRRQPWLSAEVRFEARQPAVCGSVVVPLDEEWRYLSGYERVDDYARLLADRIRSAAHEVLFPPIRPTPPRESAEIASRWQWLLERLALNGEVEERDDGTIHVIRDDGGEFTAIVTPEQWARIAEPIDPYSDDPEDFNPLHDEEAFLVFYEDSMMWSTRAALPPVPFGAEIKRSLREARERGDDMSQYGWFAYSPLGGAGEPFGHESG